MGAEVAPPSHVSFTEQFYETFPQYLAIGMTYDQFWNDDAGLVRFYRKAAKIQNQRESERAWLQGAYFYEALCDVAPVLHAYAKKGTKPWPYPKEPYRLGEEPKTAIEQEKQEEKAVVGVRSFMEAWASAINVKFAEKKEVAEHVGSDD